MPAFSLIYKAVSISDVVLIMLSYIECVFELEDPMAKAGPGEDFRPN